MPLVLGAKIATLGGGWRRVTKTTDYTNGLAYVRLNTKNEPVGGGVTSSYAPSISDLSESKVFVTDPPKG